MTKFIKMMSVVLALFASTSFAADNSIYIDQAGDTSTINILQNGAGNVIRGIQGVGTDNTTPAKIRGNSNSLDIQQVGSSNTLSLGVNTSIASPRAYGIDLTYYVTGNNGSAIFNVNNAGTGVAGSNFIDVRQTGNYAGINLNMLGSKNNFTATTAGGANNTITATVDADSTTNNIAVSGGGGNGITLNLTSPNATNNMTIAGAGNTLSLTQSGQAGVNGHAFTLDLTGSSNTFNVTQGGSIDTTVNVLSAGSNNNWTINTHN